MIAPIFPEQQTQHCRGFTRDRQARLRGTQGTCTSRETVAAGDFPKRTDYVATNDMAQDSTQATQKVCGLRWKIEQFHREGKQTTGLEGYQCRLARIQRNHIACTILIWVRLKQVAQEMASTIYQLRVAR